MTRPVDSRRSTSRRSSMALNVSASSATSVVVDPAGTRWPGSRGSTRRITAASPGAGAGAGRRRGGPRGGRQRPPRPPVAGQQPPARRGGRGRGLGRPRARAGLGGGGGGGAGGGADNGRLEQHPGSNLRPPF